ncbi:MAG: hypothetical protein HQL36_10995 [Alphaproteobacteria bacterium]|nr:hypothetical protein [Alphaproteobacteria bacterium]MBF0249041.1 hypothetical protein [Alphaproteobacteria bacterium]
MFRLLRYFSVASFILFVVSATLVWIYVYHHAQEDIVASSERQNVSLARLLQNSIWPSYATALLSLGERDPERLKAAPFLGQLDEDIRALSHGLPVHKVKIYALDGATLYSSIPKEIGLNKSTNAGFLGAKSGQVVSQLTFRDAFNAFEGEIFNRDLVTSYIPVRSDGDGVVAVFELYTDVTEVKERIQSTAIWTAIGLPLVFIALWVILLLIVRRADCIIRDQYGMLTETADELIAARDEMEERVVTRTRELMIEKERAESSSRAKSAFLANMSHELRTPLNAVIGFSSIMNMQLYGPLGDPRYQSYADHIQSSSNHLLDLINDVLDLTKIEEGLLPLHEEHFDMAAVVEESMLVIRPHAEREGVRVETNLCEAISDVYADRRRIKQVMINLLNNAVKFTPEGGAVSLTAQVRDNQDLAIVVRDTGIGMSDDDIVVALAPFQQVDQGLNRKYEGTGLGLPLTKKLVELHQGAMVIESATGRGTAVHVTLPGQRVCRAAEAARQSGI